MKMTKGEHIFTLMTMRLAGELPPEEVAELDSLIASDPALQERWNTLCATFAAGDIDTQFERFAPPVSAASPKVFTGIEVRRGVWRRCRAAGGPLLVCTGSFPQYNASARKTQPPSGAVVLSTASGQTIDVARAGNIDGWQAEADSEALRITAADEAAGWNRLSVPPGLTYRIVLPDGSRIWLNSASQLQFPGAFHLTSGAYACRGKHGWKSNQNQPNPLS